VSVMLISGPPFFDLLFLFPLTWSTSSIPKSRDLCLSFLSSNRSFLTCRLWRINSTIIAIVIGILDQLAGACHCRPLGTYTEPRTTGNVIPLPASVGLSHRPVVSFGPQVADDAELVVAESARAMTLLGSCLVRIRSRRSTGTGSGRGLGCGFRCSRCNDR
jgi:hypothetical protein